MNPIQQSPGGGDAGHAPKPRSDSLSQRSDDSQTAADFIRDQMQLEADAREAMPYSIESCTKPLGPLRQSVFACLTCNPVHSDNEYNAAGVCYACSVQCHGEHELVEIFNKRNFTCDCGTTRLPATNSCSLRLNPATNIKGGVHSEHPDPNNKYNHNFRNRFCGCAEDYDPFKQKGTMYQCLGLGTHEDGGCGEDWWHPGCLVGLGPNGWPKWLEEMEKNGVKKQEKPAPAAGALETISEDAVPQDGDNGSVAHENGDDDAPPPPGFPTEDDFDGFICYKCVEAFPWVKRYAGAPGFLAPVFHKEDGDVDVPATSQAAVAVEVASTRIEKVASNKRTRSDDEDTDTQESKRLKSDETGMAESSTTPETVDMSLCRLPALGPAPRGKFSLFFKEDFREKICHCSSCFPLLKPHPQLLEEEEVYEPPVSEQGSENGGSTQGSGSLLERGESALRNIDRVRAIEGVMAYNHLKDKLKPFFQQFAESGQAISADDIKDYFAKLRGDDQVVRGGDEAAESDFRREQSGY